MIQLLLIFALIIAPFHSTYAFEEPAYLLDEEMIDPMTHCDNHLPTSYPPQDFPFEISSNPQPDTNRQYLKDQKVPANAYYVPDGSFEYPYSYQVEAPEGECRDYEKYPGYAYESSISTAKIVTTIVVGAAFIAVVAVLLVNTPKSGCCHSKRGSCGH
jgi:hypothetical protein